MGLQSYCIAIDRGMPGKRARTMSLRAHASSSTLFMIAWRKSMIGNSQKTAKQTCRTSYFSRAHPSSSLIVLSLIGLTRPVYSPPLVQGLQSAHHPRREIGATNQQTSSALSSTPSTRTLILMGTVFMFPLSGMDPPEGTASHLISCTQV